MDAEIKTPISQQNQNSAFPLILWLIFWHCAVSCQKKLEVMNLRIPWPRVGSWLPIPWRMTPYSANKSANHKAFALIRNQFIIDYSVMNKDRVTPWTPYYWSKFCAFCAMLCRAVLPRLDLKLMNRRRAEVMSSVSQGSNCDDAHFLFTLSY